MVHMPNFTRSFRTSSPKAPPVDIFTSSDGLDQQRNVPNASPLARSESKIAAGDALERQLDEPGTMGSTVVERPSSRQSETDAVTPPRRSTDSRNSSPRRYAISSITKVGKRDRRRSTDVAVPDTSDDAAKESGVVIEQTDDTVVSSVYELRNIPSQAQSTSTCISARHPNLASVSLPYSPLERPLPSRPLPSLLPGPLRKTTRLRLKAPSHRADHLDSNRAFRTNRTRLPYTRGSKAPRICRKIEGGHLVDRCRDARLRLAAWRERIEFNRKIQLYLCCHRTRSYQRHHHP
jgi:hypothetical protein